MDWNARYKEAANRIAEETAKPLDDGCTGSGSYFDPWGVFDCFYGSYSADFDWVAVTVLEGLLDHEKAVWDLPSHMFREILCTKNLCDYGTSPRACFPTSEFEKVLPDFITKWKEYYQNHWGEAYPDHGHTMMVRRDPL